MNDCNALLGEVMDQARALKIPFSPLVAAQVVINRRAATRFGCCRWVGGRYVIEVAERVAQGGRERCMEILAHELLHTCWGCRNHGKRWKSYAARMNAAYGYEIQRAATNEKMGVAPVREAKYVIRCQRCGQEFERLRASRLTRRPEEYRCRCGGQLVRVK